MPELRFTTNTETGVSATRNGQWRTCLDTIGNVFKKVYFIYFL